MKDEPDKQAFKFKKKQKKRKKEKESNSSRDSLELTIESYKNNNKITQKETEEGEKIKFFFNELPTNKINRFATASNRKFQKLNLQKEKEEFDFREILLNYVNQTGRTNENKSHKKERNSVIYTKPNAVLTLNGDSETNKNEFSNQISESSSEYISESKSLSNSSADKKTEKIEHLHKKIIEENDKNKNSIKNNSKKIIPKKNNIINDKNKKKEKKSLKKDETNKKEVKKEKKVNILSDKKVKNSEKNNETVINSNYNKLTNSNKIKSSNTFTTGANTFNTQNTQNSSFKSLQQNIKKFNYDYLNLTDISLQKKLLIQNRINSSKKLIKEEKEKGNKNIKVKNDIFDKVRNINISLDVEKSYSNYFKQIINLQKQKNNYKNIPDKKVNLNINKERNTCHSNKFNKRYFYYPDEFYINRNSNLYSKSHISKLFENLRKKC